MASFSHHDLQLLNLSFDSPLVDVLSELEYLRRLKLEGDTPPQFFPAQFSECSERTRTAWGVPERW